MTYRGIWENFVMRQRQPLSDMFHRFFESEKTAGVTLIAATLISLLIANSSAGQAYLGFWQQEWLGLSMAEWINDGLMAIFFLLIGLELEREIYTGELSTLKNASLPFFAAVGGMLLPALIHYSVNGGTPTQDGAGIPMATDIAFALGVLALLGNRVPPALKVFVVAFAVIDDLGAILVIGLFYSSNIAPYYLLAALALWGLLLFCNYRRVMPLTPYVIAGAILWFLMLKSGVHPTIAGVMLAFAVPFSHKAKQQTSPSYRLEQMLHVPAAFFILPLFALANTAIPIAGDWSQHLTSANFIGITLGLVAGKPLGVMLFSWIGIALGYSKLPQDVSWRHLLGAGMLGGIGFTMSIFITNLAFHALPELVNASKIAIMAASLLAGSLGYMWLRYRTT